MTEPELIELEVECDCGWTGIADVTATRIQRIWECPRCKVTHDDNWEDFNPDADYREGK